jgi:hypothetical protein
LIAPKAFLIAGVMTSIVAASISSHATPATPPPGEARREFNLFPLVGGDSDVGIGFGQVSDWAKLGAECQSFCWRLETAAFISFKLRDDNSRLIVPFQDYYLLFSRPSLGPGGRFRLDLRASFTDETTLLYYGIGNAAPEPPPSTPLAAEEYKRIHPTATALGRAALGKDWFVEGGLQYTRNWLTVAPDSLLAQMQAGSSPAAPFLKGNFAAPHGVALIDIGLQYDTRDSEIVTREGMFHTAHLRISPQVGTALPYGYEQLNLTARFFYTPWPRWLTLSWRVVNDVMVGSPPFYELARFEETAAIGGVKGVRGVPAQRYYGKVKLFQNLEARSEIFPFTIGNKPMVLGVALFADAGRLWSELEKRQDDLDGTGWGIKYGLGGGLRLQQGQTFVVRADLAWSPDAHPIGAYFAAGEIF